MIIKHAPWEKRNLNVNCCEFYIDLNDDNSVFDEINKCNDEYQVLHITCGNTSALIEAQKNGFTMIETNIRLSANVEDIILPSIYNRYESKFSYSIATEIEQLMIIDEISKGKIFTTDKVARDPYFGSKCAGKRYAMWSDDLLKREDVQMVLPKYNNEIVGFAIHYIEKEKIFNLFLGGILPEYEGKGLGFMTIYANSIAAKEAGAKKLVTGVSSNNLPILKLHEILGYKVTNLSYALIKHN